MAERFFVESPVVGETAILTGAEVQHLVKVMRGSVGDEVFLFDGSGDEFSARVARIERNAVHLEMVVRRAVNRELPFQLVAAVALPKGERQRWLVEKLTELGVTSLVPLITDRCVVRPEASSSSRLLRTVIETSKQCRRNRLMEVATPQLWREFVEAAPRDGLRLVAHPPDIDTVETPGAESSAGLPARQGRDVLLAVGPEGGFSPPEVQCAIEAGWQRVQLGPRILRVETAAIALAADYAVHSSRT